MWKKKNKTRKNTYSQTQRWLHWGGFLLSVCVITIITAYGIWQSVRPFSFNSAPEEPLALVGVALANNLGTWASRLQEIPVNLPAEVVPTQEALIHEEAGATNSSLASFFASIGEYEDIARLDVMEYLSQKSDREGAIETYILQLDDATLRAKWEVQNLVQQSQYYEQANKEISTTIKQIQDSLESSYANRDSQAIGDTMAQLDESWLTQNTNTYNQLFLERMVRDYTNLIQYSELKLSILKTNIPALVSGVSVNLPSDARIADLEQMKIFSREN